jgi:hypothetical protein
LFSTWCGLDLHHDDFWDVTLREYDLITGGRIKAKDQEFKAWRVLNQELGILVQFAFHDPKKMPDLTKAAEPAKSAIRDRAQDLNKLRAGLMALHFQSKKGK